MVGYVLPDSHPVLHLLKLPFHCGQEFRENITGKQNLVLHSVRFSGTEKFSRPTMCCVPIRGGGGNGRVSWFRVRTSQENRIFCSVPFGGDNRAGNFERHKIQQEYFGRCTKEESSFRAVSILWLSVFAGCTAYLFAWHATICRSSQVLLKRGCWAAEARCHPRPFHQRKKHTCNVEHVSNSAQKYPFPGFVFAEIKGWKTRNSLFQLFTWRTQALVTGVVSELNLYFLILCL